MAKMPLPTVPATPNTTRSKSVRCRTSVSSFDSASITDKGLRDDKKKPNKNKKKNEQENEKRMRKKGSDNEWLNRSFKELTRQHAAVRTGHTNIDGIKSMAIL